jgi:hypothetical protein
LPQKVRSRQAATSFDQISQNPDRKTPTCKERVCYESKAEVRPCVSFGTKQVKIERFVMSWNLNQKLIASFFSLPLALVAGIFLGGPALAQNETLVFATFKIPIPKCGEQKFLKLEYKDEEDQKVKGMGFVQIDTSCNNQKILVDAQIKDLAANFKGSAFKLQIGSKKEEVKENEKANFETKADQKLEITQIGWR